MFLLEKWSMYTLPLPKVYRDPKMIGFYHLFRIPVKKLCLQHPNLQVFVSDNCCEFVLEYWTAQVLHAKPSIMKCMRV